MLELPLLVTVGSPLAVKEIQDLVAQPLEVPAGVGAWLNASDFRDVVALDHDDPARVRPGRAPHRRDGHEQEREPPRAREYLAAPAVRDAVTAELAARRRPASRRRAADDDQLNREHGHLLEALRPGAPLRQPRALLRRLGGELRREQLRRRADVGRTARACCARTARLIAEAGGALTLDFLRAGTYADGQDGRDDDRLDAGPEPVADARRAHLDDEIADVAYGRVAPRRGGGLWLQYWLFYFHSAKGIPGVAGADGLLGAGLHQGDWELVQVGIPRAQVGAADPRPDVAVLAAHDYAHRIAWAERDTRGRRQLARLRRACVARELPQARPLARQEARAAPARPARRLRRWRRRAAPSRAAADPDRRARVGRLARACGASRSRSP